MANVKRGALYIEGLDETQKVFRRFPKEIKKGADEQVRDVARFVASVTQAAATTRPERKVARTIKAQKQSVSLGGGGRKQAAGSMAMGTEFGGRGSKRTRQFRAHRGREGYFFWPTIRQNSGKIKKMWDDLVENIIKEMTSGG